VKASRLQRLLLRADKHDEPLGAQLVGFDGFSGVGGWSQALEQAGGRAAAAVNHWDIAVRPP